MFLTFFIALAVSLTVEVAERRSAQPLSAFPEASTSVAVSPGDGTRAPIPLCELAAHPQRYAGKTVRTTAIIVAGLEQSFLYHPACNNLESFIWVEYGARGGSSTAKMRTLQRLIARKVFPHEAGRAQVTIVGRFEGPEGKRYGHLDQFFSQIHVIQVQQAKTVPEGAPWPVSVASPDSTLDDDQQIRSLSNVLVFHLAGSARNKEISSELLADDFSFSDIGARPVDRMDFLSMSVPPFDGTIQNTETRVYVRNDTASSTGVMQKLRDSVIIEKERYEIRFVRRPSGWQVRSIRLFKSARSKASAYLPMARSTAPRLERE